MGNIVAFNTWDMNYSKKKKEKNRSLGTYFILSTRLSESTFIINLNDLRKDSGKF